MDGATRERVTERLDALQREYEGFDVQQTTVTARPEEHERAAAGPAVDVRVRVRNDDGEVLVVDDSLPERQVGEDTSPAVAAQEAVREATGVDCVIEGLERVAIVCVRDEAGERDPVYRLTAQFAATALGGDPACGDWETPASVGHTA